MNMHTVTIMTMNNGPTRKCDTTIQENKRKGSDAVCVCVCVGVGVCVWV